MKGFVTNSVIKGLKWIFVVLLYIPTDFYFPLTIKIAGFTPPQSYGISYPGLLRMFMAYLLAQLSLQMYWYWILVSGNRKRACVCPHSTLLCCYTLWRDVSPVSLYDAWSLANSYISHQRRSTYNNVSSCMYIVVSRMSYMSSTIARSSSTITSVIVLNLCQYLWLG